MTRDIRRLLRENSAYPGRKRLPLHVKMFRFPDECINELRGVADRLQGENDLYQPHYGLSQTIRIAQQVAYSTPGYTQHLLQLPNDDGFQTEQNYVMWNDMAPLTRRFMEENWPVCFRARIAILQPQTTIPWHIDDDTSVSVRFHVNLNEGQTRFYFKTKGEETSMELEPYWAHFLNVGYPHKVENGLDFPRINFLWGSTWPSASRWLADHLLDGQPESDA